MHSRRHSNGVVGGGGRHGKMNRAVLMRGRNRTADNFYYDCNVRDNQAYWTAGKKLFLEPDWEEAFWLNESDKTELSNEWYVSLGNHISLTNAAAGSNGAAYYTGAGVWFPSQNELGRCVNNVDFSKLYDAMRALLWVRWDNGDASDQVGIDVASRASKGSTNWGGISVRVDRNASSLWGVVAYDGEGGTTTQNTTLNGNGIYAAVQVEFVKASHVKFKVVSAGSVAGYATPSWPIAESGYWKNIALTSGGYLDLNPMPPALWVGSSVDTAAASPIAWLTRFAFEYRPIGGAFKTLV